MQKTYNLKMHIVRYGITDEKTRSNKTQFNVKLLYVEIYPNMTIGDIRAAFNNAFPAFIKLNYPNVIVSDFLTSLDSESENLLSEISDYTKTNKFQHLYDEVLFWIKNLKPKCVVVISVE
jgi:hypothetical protein